MKFLKSMRATIFSCCSLLLVLLFLSACATNTTAASSTPVKLGLAVPLSGPDQAAGNRTLQAVRMAVEQRNQQGGTSGHPIELVVHNDAETDGATVARWLARDPAVLAALGHPQTPVAEAAAPMYQERSLPLLLLGSARVTQNPKNAPVLYFAPPPEQLAQAAVRFTLNDLKATTAAAVVGHDPGDAAQVSWLQDAAQAAGLRLVATASLFPGSTQYESVVAQLRAARPDVLLVAANLPDSAAFWKDAVPTARASIILSRLPQTSSEFAALAGPQARSAYFPTFLPAEPSPDRTAFITTYQARWNAAPDDLALLAYDSANLLLEAVHRALARSAAPDRAAVWSELKSIDSFPSITGLLAFDETGVRKDLTINFKPATP